MKSAILFQLIVLFSIKMFGQVNQLIDTTGIDLPSDTSIRMEVLDNGLTTYFKHSDEFDDKVVLFFVVKTGVAQEKENEIGVSHLLEHLVVRRTTSFPDGVYKHFAQYGLQDGRDFNAFTGFEATTYMLVLPHDNPRAIRSAIQLIGDLLNEPQFDSIDLVTEQRAVTNERLRAASAQSRLDDFINPKLLEPSPYARCIGNFDERNVEKLDRDALLRFWNHWYRPDLQAVIFVGPIDADSLLTNIKALTSHERPKRPRKQPQQYPTFVPSPNKLIVATDPEVSHITVRLYWKLQGKRPTIQATLEKSLLAQLYNYMIQHRIDKLLRQYNSPFMSCDSRYRENAISGLRGMDALTLIITTLSVNAMEGAIKSAYFELDRVRRMGFTEAEFQTAKDDLLTTLQNEKADAKRLAWSMQRHFVYGDPVFAIPALSNVTKEMLTKMSVDDVNSAARRWITDNDRDIVFIAPENHRNTLPAESTVTAWLKDVGRLPMTPYVDQPFKKQLPDIENLDKHSPPATQRYIKEIDATRITLANGVKVLLKPVNTNGSKKSILLHAFKTGGARSYPEKDYFTAVNAARIVEHSGAGGLDRYDIERYSQLHNLQVSPYVNDFFFGISGRCNAANLQLMLQLAFNYITSPRKDSIAFQDWKTRQHRVAASLSLQHRFAAKIWTYTGENPLLTTPPELSHINLDKAYQIYTNAMSNANGFTFVFTGDFQTSDVVPVIEKYLGNLPTHTAKPPGEIHKRPPANARMTFREGMDNDGAEVGIRFEGTFAPTLENIIHLDLLVGQLQGALTDRLRNIEKGVYAAGVEEKQTLLSQRQYIISIFFKCTPEVVDQLIAAAKEEITSLCEGRIDPAMLQNGIHNAIQTASSNVTSAKYWIDYLSRQDMLRQEPRDILRYTELISATTPDVIRRAAIQYLDMSKCQEFVRLPDSRSSQDQDN